MISAGLNLLKISLKDNRVALFLFGDLNAVSFAEIVFCVHLERML
jgi:hypothetical protein